ncbi:MAG: polyprenyl synthetase family protein [Flavobacteriales bacterium]|nr:polyprenyl synthetase family protein [Flavobacteriales bacterium]
MEEYLKIIEGQIKSSPFAGKPSNLYDPLNYIISLGGKRVRPVLALMGCSLFDYNWERAIPAAMAVEVFHNFSLIHDDIMDHAVLRRGNKTVHEKWDVPNAILSGDLMLVKAYDWLMKCDTELWHLLFGSFNKMATEVCEGQQMDMNFEVLDSVSENDYLEMIRLKTSVLLGCSIELGAIIARADETDRKKLYQFGVNMGMAFQLMDDYLDTFGDPLSTGKRIGGDIVSGKKTILYIHALNQLGSGFLKDFNHKDLDAETKVGIVKQHYVEAGSDKHLLRISESFYSKAKRELEAVKVPSEKKSDLEKLLGMLQNRAV